MADVAIDSASRPRSGSVHSTLCSVAIAARYLTTRYADGGATPSLWATRPLTHSDVFWRAAAANSGPYLRTNAAFFFFFRGRQNRYAGSHLSSSWMETSLSSGTSQRTEAQISVHIASFMSGGHSFSALTSATRS